MPRLSAAQIYDKLAARGLATGPRPPDVSARKKRRQEESRMQRQLVRWFDLNAKNKFGLQSRHLFAIPNGGFRGPTAGAIIKAEGGRRGVPDLMVCVKTYDRTRPGTCETIHGAHGLFLELKTEQGRVAEEQKAFHELLTAQGYQVNVIRSFDEGVEVITKYLEGR